MLSRCSTFLAEGIRDTTWPAAASKLGSWVFGTDLIATFFSRCSCVYPLVVVAGEVGIDKEGAGGVNGEDVGMRLATETSKRAVSVLSCTVLQSTTRMATERLAHHSSARTGVCGEG